MIIDSFPQRLNENPYSSGDASAPTHLNELD